MKNIDAVSIHHSRNSVSSSAWQTTSEALSEDISRRKVIPTLSVRSGRVASHMPLQARSRASLTAQHPAAQMEAVRPQTRAAVAIVGTHHIITFVMKVVGYLMGRSRIMICGPARSANRPIETFDADLGSCFWGASPPPMSCSNGRIEFLTYGCCPRR